MSLHDTNGRWSWHRVTLLGAAIITLGTITVTWVPAMAGALLARSRVVGGVAIDAKGLLDAAKVDHLKEWHVERAKALQPIPAGLQGLAPMRKVSLRRLEEAIREHRENKVVPLDDSFHYLAGLQSIQYVFVYPEEHDIVLVGPGEGWKIDGLGNVVGVTTGRPVLLLDDLFVALRSVADARQNGIQCSIDPTAEGLVKLQAYVNKIKDIDDDGPEQTMRNIEQLLGEQTVTVGGVAPDSHFARVMVAADFRMKRLAMNFEKAPVSDLPSFLQLLSGGGKGMGNLLPRWWLAPKADALAAAPDGLSFELRGVSVECRTEEDLLAADGTRKPTGKSGSVAQRWADTFTAKYGELSKVDTVFGQLRNLMDLAIVAALIEQRQLFQTAGFEAPHLMSEEPSLKYHPPKRVNSRVSFLKKGRTYIISASGGVEMLPAQAAAKTQVSEALTPIRKKAIAEGENWWWN